MIAEVDGSTITGDAEVVGTAAQVEHPVDGW
jgi:hypothetical protein